MLPVMVKISQSADTQETTATGHFAGTTLFGHPVNGYKTQRLMINTGGFTSRDDSVTDGP